MMHNDEVDPLCNLSEHWQSVVAIVRSNCGNRNKHEPTLSCHSDEGYLCGVLKIIQMKALIIIVCCVALTLILTAAEKFRLLKQQKTQLQLDDLEKLQEQLKRYRDLID